jgi:hypothetical protein
MGENVEQAKPMPIISKAVKSGKWGKVTLLEEKSKENMQK